MGKRGRQRKQQGRQANSGRVMPDNKGRQSATQGKRFAVEVLTSSEVSSLLSACSGRAPTGVRNRALIVVLYRGGLRISEALALYPKDVDLRSGTVAVLQGKGGKQRVVGLDPQACAVIEKWMVVRKKRGGGLKGRCPLFCTLEGKTMYPSYVRALLPRLARKAGIHKRVHPHGLRHTHAAELASEGMPMNLIQAQLGHTNLGTTSRYLAHIAPAELVAAIQARTW